VFTGSTDVGREIASSLAPSLTPSTLELSGSDTAIVLADADVELAAASIHFALVLNAGQSCMAPRRVIVEGGAHEAFAEAFRKRLQGDQVSRLVRGGEAERCRALIEQARRSGATVVGGERESGDGFGPTAAFDCPADADLASSDHFGPAIAVIRSDSRERTLELAGLSPKALATSIFAGKPAEAGALARRIDAGFVTINDCLLPTAHPGASISGRGPSGWGVSRGQLGLLAMTRPRFVSRSSRTLRIPTEEPSERARRNIEKFVRWRYGR
jgi:aldehyde dehydrogenase (NAD+)